MLRSRNSWSCGLILDANSANLLMNPWIIDSTVGSIIIRNGIWGISSQPDVVATNKVSDENLSVTRRGQTSRTKSKLHHSEFNTLRDILQKPLYIVSVYTNQLYTPHFYIFLDQIVALTDVTYTLRNLKWTKGWRAFWAGKEAICPWLNK